MSKKQSGDIRPPEFYDELRHTKEALRIWVKARAPYQQEFTINDPLIWAFWEFYQRSSIRKIITDQEKEEIFQDFLKKYRS